MWHVYTDGSSEPNLGNGSCAFIILDSNGKKIHEKAHVQLKGHSTNQRMEMSAVIMALSWIKKNKGCVDKVKVYTDSQYVQKGIDVWIKDWKARNWVRSGGGAVKNKDLWLLLDEYVEQFDTLFEWVRRHNGNEWNERADQLCTDIRIKHFGNK